MLNFANLISPRLLIGTAKLNSQIFLTFSPISREPSRASSRLVETTEGRRSISEQRIYDRLIVNANELEMHFNDGKVVQFCRGHGIRPCMGE